MTKSDHLPVLMALTTIAAAGCVNVGSIGAIGSNVSGNANSQAGVSATVDAKADVKVDANANVNAPGGAAGGSAPTPPSPQTAPQQLAPVTGTVTDQEGNPVSGATVVARLQSSAVFADGSPTLQTRSQSGRYMLATLPVGQTVLITVSFPPASSITQTAAVQANPQGDPTVNRQDFLLPVKTLPLHLTTRSSADNSSVEAKVTYSAPNRGLEPGAPFFAGSAVDLSYPGGTSSFEVLVEASGFRTTRRTVAPALDGVPQKEVVVYLDPDGTPPRPVFTPTPPCASCVP